MRRILSFVRPVACVLALGLAAHLARAAPEVGQKAPSFAAPQLGGQFDLAASAARSSSTISGRPGAAFAKGRWRRSTPSTAAIRATAST